MMSTVAAGAMMPHPPIILPNIGRGEEKKIADIDQACRQAADVIAKSEPETVVIISPHAPSYLDYVQLSDGTGASGSLAQFGDYQDAFSIAYDKELVDEISRLAALENFPAGTLGKQDGSLDHGTMIPLYYLQNLPKDTKFVRVSVGGLGYPDHYHLGTLIQKAAENLGRKVAVVASGDLSHCQKADSSYGYKVCGPAYDKEIMEIMKDADFLTLLEQSPKEASQAMVCGHPSFCIMAGMMDGQRPESRELAHSAEFGVGYGICTYDNLTEDESRHFEKPAREAIAKAKELARSKEDPWVQLARKSVESWVLHHQKLRLPAADTMPKEMSDEKAGVFVSIHENGALRGCIGTTAPAASCVAQEIIDNAISASSRDPRFMPIQPNELDDLEINVDVLMPPEPIASPDQLDVHKYGVIVSKGGRRGLLLPDLEGVDSVEKQLAIAKEKAGLSPDEKGCSLERFEVVRHV